jgi:hypothetical protein
VCTIPGFAFLGVGERQLICEWDWSGWVKFLAFESAEGSWSLSWCGELLGGSGETEVRFAVSLARICRVEFVWRRRGS